MQKLKRWYFYKENKHIISFGTDELKYAINVMKHLHGSITSITSLVHMHCMYIYIGI